ncbi:MAG: glutamine synthetase [Clostridiales bacterium]|nr:glutamine synthetase [Clostridiales bacterium]
MTDFHVIPELLYVIPTEKHSAGDIRSILEAHPEIKFVSLAAVDLMGNDTDEKIPISDFKSNLENYLNGHAVQTDGSSVVLPGIATLNDGKVDLIPDPEVIWYIDYNYEHTDPITKLPIGTLRIPSYLKHGDDMVCSRSILKKSADFFEKQIKDIFKQRPDICSEYGFKPEELAKITLITATELEFWVNSPDEIISTEQLSISQELKESYWKRTKGVVRTALEQVIMVLEQYGFNPEMGHKEVGGVKASLTSSGEFHFIMEQLEVDWKYSDALQGADYELIARILIKEIFRLHGLDVSFDAKPLQGVAGSGEHTHVNAVANLKDGRKINLFTPADMSKDYLSKIGWGCLMGIMKHYNIISPFVSATTDAFERLTPGFEAPTHAVASIGMDVLTPSRNRSVLLGLVRSIDNKYATRFELRAPNPHTNTYLCLAAVYQSMLDGIAYVLSTDKDTKALEAEFIKPYGESSDYLEKDRLYRCEDDIFEDMDSDERDRLFGKPSENVYHSIYILKSNPDVEPILCNGDVFNSMILDSYYQAMLGRWEMELLEKIIPANLQTIRNVVRKDDGSNSYDDNLWNEIVSLKVRLAKDSDTETSIFTKIKNAIGERNWEETSKYQLEMKSTMKELRAKYKAYCENQI